MADTPVLGTGLCEFDSRPEYQEDKREGFSAALLKRAMAQVIVCRQHCLPLLNSLTVKIAETVSLHCLLMGRKIASGARNFGSRPNDAAFMEVWVRGLNQLS